MHGTYDQWSIGHAWAIEALALCLCQIIVQAVMKGVMAYILKSNGCSGYGGGGRLRRRQGHPWPQRLEAAGM